MLHNTQTVCRKMHICAAEQCLARGVSQSSLPAQVHAPDANMVWLSCVVFSTTTTTPCWKQRCVIQQNQPTRYDIDTCTPRHVHVSPHRCSIPPQPPPHTLRQMHTTSHPLSPHSSTLLDSPYYTKLHGPVVGKPNRKGWDGSVLYSHKKTEKTTKRQRNEKCCIHYYKRDTVRERARIRASLTTSARTLLGDPRSQNTLMGGKRPQMKQ